MAYGMGERDMQPSLSDLELKVMAIIWRNGGEASAKQIFTEMHEEFGYTRGAVYALIHRCIEKRTIERENPGFVCRSIVDPDEMRLGETKKLINTVFDGSASKLVSALVSHGEMTSEDIAELRRMIDEIE